MISVAELEAYRTAGKNNQKRLDNICKQLRDGEVARYYIDLRDNYFRDWRKSPPEVRARIKWLLQHLCTAFPHTHGWIRDELTPEVRMLMPSAAEAAAAIPDAMQPQEHQTFAHCANQGFSERAFLELHRIPAAQNSVHAQTALRHVHIGMSLLSQEDLARSEYWGLGDPTLPPLTHLFHTLRQYPLIPPALPYIAPAEDAQLLDAVDAEGEHSDGSITDITVHASIPTNPAAPSPVSSSVAQERNVQLLSP